MVTFVQQCFAKAEVLPKCGKIKVFARTNVGLEVDIFNFKRAV